MSSEKEEIIKLYKVQNGFITYQMYQKQQQIISEQQRKQQIQKMGVQQRIQYKFKDEIETSIPISSIWFNLTQIHQIEWNSFYELQQDSIEQDQRYFNLRNQILDIFYQNKTLYLTATQTAQLLAEEISFIFWVHSFLDHWGLINNLFEIENHSLQTANMIVQGNINKLDQLNENKTDPILCDICSKLCETKYFKEKVKKEQKEKMIKQEEDALLQICSFCYIKQQFPKIYVKSDFKEIIVEQKVQMEITQEEIQQRLETLKALRESQYNLSQIKALFPQLSLTNIIYNILITPNKLLNQSNKYTSKNFEEVFKEKHVNELDQINKEKQMKAEQVFEDLKKQIQYDQKAQETIKSNVANSILMQRDSIKNLLIQKLQTNQQKINILSQQILQNNEAIKIVSDLEQK